MVSVLPSLSLLQGLQLTKEQLNSLVMPSFALLLPSLYLLQGLQLTKEQLNSVADGGSLRTALVAENSHQVRALGPHQNCC